MWRGYFFFSIHEKYKPVFLISGLATSYESQFQSPESHPQDSHPQESVSKKINQFLSGANNIVIKQGKEELCVAASFCLALCLITNLFLYLRSWHSLWSFFIYTKNKLGEKYEKNIRFINVNGNYASRL
jgi:hypothetical protein